MTKAMVKKLQLRLVTFLNQLKTMDLLDFNHFIFKHLILRSFKSENILPVIISLCVIGFSIVVEDSRFLFIPQTSVAAYASFFIFTLVASIITLIIYPTLIIFSVNFICSYVKGNTSTKLLLKLLTLTLSFITVVAVFLPPTVVLHLRIQIVLIWLGLYFILAELYLAHYQHNSVTKLSKTTIAFMLIITLTMVQPLVLIFIHTAEAVNFTTINPQIYLNAQNCALLRDLEGKTVIESRNSIFNDQHYFQSLANNQGCYIYANTIRYSFAYDFVLLVKKNIYPLVGKSGTLYNEYVRLSCYAGNCYSENHFFFNSDEDIYAELIHNGKHLAKPL